MLYTINEYIDDSDGFLLTHNGTVSLTTAQSIREGGEFFPICFLVHQTIGGYHPDGIELRIWLVNISTTSSR